MGGYEQLKAAISAIIRTNNNQEITGATLQSTLLSIINTIAQGSTFKGVATTSTNPGSPDANVFYIAGRPGYYPNFNLELAAGLHVIENKTGGWVNTEIQLDVVDAVNIGGAKHVKPSQAMIIALQTTEQIPDTEGLNNKMWWSTDGNLKYKQSDIVYNLGSPAYVLYYCGDKIYRWTGSAFREIGGGGSFASGEALSNMTLFDDGADTEGKTSSQLAAMIPSGAVIRSILDLISSIDTSGGAYDGSDLITTFSYDAPTRVITIKQASREAKTLILPLATNNNAGLMSAQDKIEHANMYNLIGKTVDSFGQSTTNEGITITLITSNGTVRTVTVPIDTQVLPNGTNAVSGYAVYMFARDSLTYKDADDLVYAPQVRILPLVSMGSTLDEGNTPAQINDNEFYYEPTQHRIIRYNNNAQPYFLPHNGQLYFNICTGKIYRYNIPTTQMVQVGGDINAASLAGKTDKLPESGMLTPDQWPRVLLYNVEPFSSEPDYAEIPVGMIYLDESLEAPYKRLYYKKTLEGTSQRIDLGAPQENTIYCHIATGKLYRWIPTQNGNDGAFQQIGGQPDIDLSQYATKNDLLTKQDALTFDDVPGNTDNPVKSVGIKQAIDNITPHIGANGNWWTGVETNPNNDTGIKAQGPKGDSVVGGSVNIVNNVNDGGEEDALSAEMGKILRIKLMKIYNALGVYAFPDGKPTLNWGSTVIKHRITASLSNLAISSVLIDGISNQNLPAQIIDGQSLSFVLNTQSDLYIIDNDNLAITMGGINIKPTAYNSDTGAVTIPAVNGDILISAVGYTYLQQNLAFQLDCFHGVTLNGAIPTKWTDLVGNIEFDLTDVTQNSDGSLVFNGSSSKGVASSGSLNVSYNSCTIEVIANMPSYPAVGARSPILANKSNGSPCAFVRVTQGSSGATLKMFICATNSTGLNPTGNYSFWFEGTNIAIASTQSDVLINGIEQQDPRHSVGTTHTYDVNDYVTGLSDVLAVGYAKLSAQSPTDYYFNGAIKAIRVYSKKLSVSEMQANYAIDKKRFNLS